MDITIDFMIFLYTILGLVIAIPLFSIATNITWRVKIMKVIKGRPYGIANFITAGNTIIQKVIRFDQDTVKYGDGRWIIEKGRVYVTDPKLNSGNKTEVDELEKFISYRAGLPQIFFDLTNMLPVRFDKENDKENISRSPSQVEATLGKEVAVATLEAMKRQKDKIMLFIIIAVMCSIAAAALGFMAWQNTNTLIDKLVPK